jgi:aspartate/methionine/tyrosine aminotransferase
VPQQRARNLPEDFWLRHIIPALADVGRTLVFSRRSERIEPFRVMQLVARARELERCGRSIVHFEVGEPDFATAAPIVDAGIAALRAGRTHYTEATGLPELKAAIAEYYRRSAGVEVDPARIVVTSGASGGLLLLSALLVDPDDEWLMSDPGYPCNRHFWTVAGGVVRALPLCEETRFKETPALLSANATAATRGLLFASPANPTGAVLGRAEMTGVLDFARERGWHRVVDEIYQGLVYDRNGDDLCSVLEVDDEAFVVNSFSKYFGMTGWRLGWIVAPPVALPALERLAQNLFIAPPTVAQYAALAALSPVAIAEHEHRREEFAARRDLLRRGLEGLGLTIAGAPRGALYLYADIGRTAIHSEDFCHRLLEEFGVAATPGTDFGSFHADRHVRFAYTTDRAAIDEGVARLARALESWRVRA